MENSPVHRPSWLSKYWDGDADAFYGSELGSMDPASQLPIIYHENYNFGLFGLEKLHPFDAKKFERIVNSLVAGKVVTRNQLVTPQQCQNRHLLLIHTPEYLESLRNSRELASIAEFPLIAIMPEWVSYNYFLRKYQYHVAGSILAGHLALKHGWSINLGGGMHHASSQHGGGWCVYSDIVLSYQHLRLNYPDKVKRILVIDLDVHQGNGHEQDKMLMNDRDNVYTLDMYRQDLYPGDRESERMIDMSVPLYGSDTDEQYLSKLKKALMETFNECREKWRGQPADVVYYIAGTDILIGDPLGNMGISPEAVIQRDELVWRSCRDSNFPVVMLLAGGYTKPLSAETVVRSITNLKEKNLLRMTGSEDVE